MELITYTEALNVLGCKIDTLRHAVSRGDLTRAGRQQRNTYLLKEQVELFSGRQISRQSLSPADKAKWERCKREAIKLQTPGGAPVDEEAINRMIEQKVRSQFLQQEAARLRKEEETARQKRERLEQENPFLMAV